MYHFQTDTIIKFNLIKSKHFNYTAKHACTNKSLHFIFEAKATTHYNYLIL